MSNKPYIWMDDLDTWFTDEDYQNLDDLLKEGMFPLYTHPVKELNDGGEQVKNATYWKRQYNLMATQNDNLKSGLYHANEQIKYLESHPVKEQRMIDVLMELAKYRMLSKDEIAELAILRKAQEK